MRKKNRENTAKTTPRSRPDHGVATKNEEARMRISGRDLWDIAVSGNILPDHRVSGTSKPRRQRARRPCRAIPTKHGIDDQPQPLGTEPNPQATSPRHRTHSINSHLTWRRVSL